LSRLREQGLDFVALVAGEGPLLSELEGLAQRLGVSGNLRFLGLRRDVQSLFSASDAFVLSSAWEGFPMVVGEAMACECTVVATNCGGVKEFVGDAGFLVPPKDPAALASRLGDALGLESEARARIGRKARERIRAHFSLESAVRRWVEIYTRGASGSRSLGAEPRS
jgi:glycosyltransferase involved in cell wall biosynthesis